MWWKRCGGTALAALAMLALAACTSLQSGIVRVTIKYE
jgi:hypothetical protein